MQLKQLVSLKCVLFIWIAGGMVLAACTPEPTLLPNDVNIDPLLELELPAQVDELSDVLNWEALESDQGGAVDRARNLGYLDYYYWQKNPQGDHVLSLHIMVENRSSSSPNKVCEVFVGRFCKSSTAIYKIALQVIRQKKFGRLLVTQTPRNQYKRFAHPALETSIARGLEQQTICPTSIVFNIWSENEVDLNQASLNTIVTFRLLLSKKEP